MLTPEERDLITDKLMRVVALAGAPRLTIVASLRSDLAAQVPEGMPIILVPKALELCVTDGYADIPPQLVKLLEKLLPQDAEISGIITRLMTPPPTTADPFEARILDSKMPFLDRVQGRAFLRALTQARPRQPVVVVVGGSRMGKTYTFEFIDHVCNRKGIGHCRVQVSPGEGAGIGPGELAREIVTQVGGRRRDTPPMTTNRDAWARELANWIVAEAEESGRRWWFVLDGFRTDELRDDTRSLIVKFSNALITGVGRKHQLILLDFDRTLLPLQPGLIASETTNPIPQSAVATVVADLIQASGKQLNAAQITAGIMSGLSNPVSDLAELNQRLSDFILGAGV